MEERKRKECIHYYLCSLRIAEQGVCLPECKKFIDKERLKDADRTSRCGGGTLQDKR
jgi:hypothetical protein